MDAAVGALLDEAGVPGEGVFTAVLEDKITVGVEDAGAEHLVGEGVDAFKGIRGVGEDNVESFVADGQEVEDVGMDDRHFGKGEAGGFALDEGGVVASHLHAPDVSRAAGGEFEGDCACAAGL